MHTFRVTVITASGQRLVLPFLVPRVQAIGQQLDELYPDRRAAIYICTSRPQPLQLQPRPH